jgi:hypothetical protein
MNGSTSVLPTRGDVERIASHADPVLRNLQITQCYHELSAAFAARLGGCANWSTFATWASKQAGLTIRKEDLRRLADEAIDAALGVRGLGEQVVALAVAAGTSLSRAAVWTAVRRVIDPSVPLERASNAVARGNLKVFAEIAPLFAQFIAERVNDASPDVAAIDGFCSQLRESDPPDGQRYLQLAFAHYYRALFEADAKARSELVHLATVEIGFHEQTRLQPEIEASLDVAHYEPRELADRLIAALFPRASVIARLRRVLVRLLRGPTPLESAIQSLADEARRQLRRVLTEQFLSIGLADGVRLRLGRDLAVPFPPSLAAIGNADLRALLERVDPTKDSSADSGAIDWTDLPERMHFICDFFRCYHERGELLVAPFTAEQVTELRRGRVPTGEL